MLEKTEGQSRMDNLEALSTMGTQDTGHIIVRENRRVNQEWTIWRHCQHYNRLAKVVFMINPGLFLENPKVQESLFAALSQEPEDMENCLKGESCCSIL